jgi:trimeric autotransporter adhesin
MDAGKAFHATVECSMNRSSSVRLSRPAKDGASHQTRSTFRLAGLLMVLMTGAVHAATYCVDTTANSLLTFCTAVPGDCSLRGAITNANNGNEGSVQEIRVQTGTYAVPGGLDFNPDGNKDDKTFSITGGWNAGCTSRTTNAANTVVNGENGATDASFHFEGNNREMVIEGLTFLNFEKIEVFDLPCPPFSICPDTDVVRVRFNAMRHGSRVQVFSADARLFSVEGNLFADLETPSSLGRPIELGYQNAESNPVIAFNTFANIQCVNNAYAAVSISTERNGTTLHHNIIQSSGCASDLYVSEIFGDAPVGLRNNLYASRSGQPPSFLSGNVISANPGFLNLPAGDYHLRESAPASAAINAGLTAVQAVQLGLSFPSQDLDGPAGQRVVGMHADIGAYESSVNDASVLVVSNTGDSGTGSLRQALISSNANGGVQKIEFNLPGACPQLILLQSPLPDISDSVEIDGYSQPGALANTQSSGSDAQLCVVVTSASATLAQAMQVPESAPAATSLILKGIAFAGTTGFNGNLTVALRLRGGKDHVIQGNAFGGIGPGNVGTLGSPNFGIQIRGVAQNVLLGGPSPEHRNTFGDTMSSAIVLNDATSGNVTPHVIQNNYIGVNPSGTTATPIGLNGIFASDQKNVSILDNTIVAVPNNAAIQIQGASATGYQIRGNRIGIPPASVATQAFRVDVGIRVGGGSGGHDIGSLGSNIQSNTITNSNQAGVWIDTSAGSGTLVRNNRIYGNGIGGSGLSIDLGVLGPLPNDTGDGDGGPNAGQNSPVIMSSVLNPGGTRQLLLNLSSVPSTSYLIDVYRSPDCAGGDRGGNMTTSVYSGVLPIGAGGSSGLSATISGSGGPAYLTAIATNLTTGDSSEVSPCFRELDDRIFSNSFD